MSFNSEKELENNLSEMFSSLCNFMDPKDVLHKENASSCLQPVPVWSPLAANSSPRQYEFSNDSLPFLPTSDQLLKEHYYQSLLWRDLDLLDNNRFIPNNFAATNQNNQNIGLNPLPRQSLPSLRNMNINDKIVSTATEFKPKLRNRFNRKTGRKYFEQNTSHLLTEDLSGIEVSLETLKSIDIGPLCSTKSNLITLTTKFYQLYSYLSMLANERRMAESLILGTDFNPKCNYFLPTNNSISVHIKFVRQCISVEYSMMLNLINSNKITFQSDMREHTNILLNDFQIYILKLDKYEKLSIFQRNGEIFQQDDRVIELDELLAVLTTFVRYSCVIFYILKHNLPEIARKERVGSTRRNIFIG